MPISYPPQVALNEFLGSTTRHTRRVEIYEADGVTRWGPDLTSLRLVGGSITVDYSRTERRALDLQLANHDDVVTSQPGGFWYDKIIKVFRGVAINERLRVPKILIINDTTDASSSATAFRKVLVDLGYGDVRINQAASVYAVDGVDYDIIISLNGLVSGTSVFLKAALEDGKFIMTFGQISTNLTTLLYPGYASTTFTAATQTSLFPTPTHPANTGWTTYPITPSVSGSYPTTPGISATYYTALATVTAGKVGLAAVASSAANPNGRGTLFYHGIDPTLVANSNFQLAIKSSMAWLNRVTAMATWECQIGEFMIDRITEDDFPNIVKVTGRDYTKKCLLSKYKQATQFTPGQTLEALITSISGAAGVTKRALPATGVTVNSTFFFDKGVTRWDAMKEICSSYNYDIFFDATGYLVIKPYSDPVLTAPVVTVNTGEDGQLVSYSKSTSDSRIYNSIVVTGESSDTSTPNVSAFAVNNSPTSPTGIPKLGERVYEYSSSFIITTAQAQAVANSFLAVHALEQFELSYDSLMMPWLEVGDILKFVDPSPGAGSPQNFLLSTITIPIELAPMSSTGKRVTIVS